MIKQYSIQLFLMLLMLLIPLHGHEKAIIVVPVADLIGIPVTNINEYNSLPLCGGKLKPFDACLRMNQLLFNITVDVIERKNDQVKISIPHLFFTTKTSRRPHTTYWTRADNIVTINQLEAKGNSTDKIPQPFSFKTNNIHKATSNTIVLIHPYHDKKTGQTFSAGTRFVHEGKNKAAIESSTIEKISNGYYVHAFDKKSMVFKKLFLPRDSCLIESHIKTRKQRRKLFVQLIRKWANLNNGSIPYVWGGCSFIQTTKDKNFLEKTRIKNNTPSCSFFTRSDCSNSPLTGLDCTGLIARAAQIAGIPYFLKNSTTITQHLKPLKKDQSIEEGDIIWIDRHAMVVSNLKNNLLVEARGYSHGYGIVHEIPLHKQFKDITTYQQLTNAIFNKKKISRINKKGEKVEAIHQINIFKLSSVWK